MRHTYSVHTYMHNNDCDQQAKTEQKLLWGWIGVSDSLLESWSYLILSIYLVLSSVYCLVPNQRSQGNKVQRVIPNT